MAHGHQPDNPIRSEHRSDKLGFIKNITKKLRFSAIAAVLGLGVLAAVPLASPLTATVNAAPPAKGLGFVWNNVIIDGNAYQIRGTVTTVKSGSTSTTTTACTYINQPGPTTTWQHYQIVGSYQVSGAQATNEQELKNFCTAHFTHGFGNQWDNVIIDGNAYHIIGTVSNDTNGSISTTTTGCKYYNQAAPGTPESEWVYLGQYYQTGGVAPTNDAELLSFCTAHFYDKG